MWDITKKDQGIFNDWGFLKGRAYMKEVRVLIKSSSYNNFHICMMFCMGKN